MAKSKRRKREKRRDNSTIAKTPSLPFSAKKLADYRVIQDRRRFDPAGRYANAKTIRGKNHELTARRSSPNRTLRDRNVRPRVQERIGFIDPARVLVCVRRNVRREVLHAKRKTGRRGQKRARWNQWSRVRCR